MTMLHENAQPRMTPYDPADITPGLLAAVAALGAQVQALRVELDRQTSIAANAKAQARDTEGELLAAQEEAAKLRLYVAELEDALRTDVSGGSALIEAAAMRARYIWSEGALS
jgi:hypothetical protein